LALALGSVVFFGFPRLETGALLGGRLGSGGTAGFSDQLTVGTVDNNKTLRQIVARVKLSRGGKPLTGADGPFYLRCVSLDVYRPNEVDGRFQWSRMPFSYFSGMPRVRGPVPESPDIIRQEIMLAASDTPYLPGIYPLRQVDGFKTTDVGLGFLDRSATHNYQAARGLLHYTAGSYAVVDQEQSFFWLRQQLKLLGSFWYTYGTDTFGISLETRRLAQKIVGEELLEQRQELARGLNDAYGRWVRQQITPATSLGEYVFFPAIMQQHDLVDQDVPGEPNNIAPAEYPLMQEIHKRYLELGELDRTMVEKIIAYLGQHHSYTLQPPVVPAPQVEEDSQSDEQQRGKIKFVDPIDEFLRHEDRAEGSEGNCEYFASAAVLLARAVDVRTRLAVGYLAEEYLPASGYFLMRQANAHCWLELYTADHDWVLYETTPVDRTPLAEGRSGYLTGLTRRLSAYLEGLQYRWLAFSATQEGQRSLAWAAGMTNWLEKMQSSHLSGTPGRARLALTAWFTLNQGESFLSLFGRWMIFFCALIALGIGLRELLAWGLPRWALRRTRRRYLQSYREHAIGFYRQMLELLQEVSIFKEPNLTAREFAQMVRAYDPGFEPVGAVSEMYYRVRFGKTDLDETERRAIDKALERLAIMITSLKKTAPHPWPWEGEQ
jgi:hypothetical protein